MTSKCSPMNTSPRIALVSSLLMAVILIPTAMVQDPATSALKLRVIPIFSPPEYNQKVIAFDVVVENTGPDDVSVRVGTILGNGIDYLEAVVLILTDSGGISSEITQFQPQGVAGQKFDWALPFRAQGPKNSFRLAIDRCWIPATKQPPPLLLGPGTYRVRAELRGIGPKYGPHPKTRSLPNFWLGMVRSDEVEFTIR